MVSQGPNSYTGEDLAEFHIHGSNAVISYFLKGSWRTRRIVD